MSLSLSRGPSVAESYQGFTTAPSGRVGDDAARRKLDVTLMLMIGMVAVGAAVGVGLGLSAPLNPPIEENLDPASATPAPLLTGLAEAPDTADSYAVLASAFPPASMESPRPRGPVASSGREGATVRASDRRAPRAAGEPRPHLPGAAAMAQNRARSPLRAAPAKPRSENPPQVRSTGWPYVGDSTNDPPH